MASRFTAALDGSLFLFGFSGVSMAGPSACSCDRDCLEGLIAQYLDAVLAHKPESLPVTPGVKFTEDCKEMKLGEELGIVAVRMNFGRGSAFQGDGVPDVGHSFKIYGNQMKAAEACCEIFPPGMSSGWE